VPSRKDEPNRAKALLKAKTYARMQAISNLLMAIEGTTISYEATGKDYMADETVRQEIEGYVRNVEVIKTDSETVDGDTIMTVTVKTPMFGNNTPGSVIMDEIAKDAEEDSNSAVVENEVKVVLKPDKQAVVKSTTRVTPPASTNAMLPAANLPLPKTTRPAGPYTSLIIDTTGYKLDRCMSPKIRKQDGSEVWGTVKADWDFVEDHGIVAYTTSLADARKNKRAGSNPLIINAVGRSGGRFYSDPVITDADADLIMAENAKSGFLDKFNVIFIKDGRL
jgi:hypothetical protein